MYKFYLFEQSNSYGVYQPPAVYVLIEAVSARNAEYIAADQLGLYFNGVDEGIDCPCCGDRWYSPEEFDNLVTPIWNKKLQLSRNNDLSCEKNQENEAGTYYYIRYKDGSSKILTVSDVLQYTPKENDNAST